MFLNWVLTLKWYEPTTLNLINCIQDNLIENLKNTSFQWNKSEIFFALFYCGLKNDDLFKTVVILYREFLADCNKKIHSLNFDDLNHIAFDTLWIQLTSQIEPEESLKVKKNMLGYVYNSLKVKAMNEVYPFAQSINSVPIGLKKGVCGSAIPIYALETGDISWLSMFGIYK